MFYCANEDRETDDTPKPSHLPLRLLIRRIIEGEYPATPNNNKEQYKAY
jgi:hypothetical protein